MKIDKDGFYYYKKFDPPFCPSCGLMTKSTYNLYSQLLETHNVNSKLDDAIQLFLKSEFEAAARDAFVTLETEIKEASGLTNLHGKKPYCKCVCNGIWQGINGYY